MIHKKIKNQATFNRLVKALIENTGVTFHKIKEKPLPITRWI
jgi:hypothetical protein